MAPAFHFISSFANNAVIIIDGLRKSESQTGLQLYNELRDLRDFEKAVSVVKRYEVSNAIELRILLENLQKDAKDGLRPVLHFECHGDAKQGLEIGESRERFAWTALEPLLRAINVATKCNLGVVMAVCSGLHAITSVKMHRATPFYFLVGSEDELLQEQIRSEMRAFYRVLLLSSDLDKALQQVPSCRSYHAEKLLAIALGRFLRQSCMGTGREKRTEYLVTEMKWRLGGFRNREQMRLIRQQAKKRVQGGMSEAAFHQFARTFLGVREPSFTYTELAQWVRSGI